MKLSQRSPDQGLLLLLSQEGQSALAVLVPCACRIIPKSPNHKGYPWLLRPPCPHHSPKQGAPADWSEGSPGICCSSVTQVLLSSLPLVGLPKIGPLEFE